MGRFWTVPNVLSLARLVLIMPAVYLILVEGPLLWLLVLFLLAVATDYFDGRVARWSQSVSEWGKVLDPFADKIAGGMVIAALTVRGDLPAWLLTAVVLRDLLILLGGTLIFRRTGHVLPSMWAGKVAVTALAVTALAALLRADPPVMQFCLVASAVLLAWSFIRYVFRFFRVFAMRAAGTQGDGSASEPV